MCAGSNPRVPDPNLGPEQHAAKSHDGYGDDWPLSYRDLARYYDIVKDYVGISGQAEGVDALPDGRFHPAMPMTCEEVQLRNRVKQKLGRTVTIGRTANITKAINGRQACHYCGPCERGCITHSSFNSAFTTVATRWPAATAHGHRGAMDGLPDGADEARDGLILTMHKPCALCIYSVLSDLPRSRPSAPARG